MTVTPEMQAMIDRIDALRASGHIIVGIDEAGRGALAGPVTAGACATPFMPWPTSLPHNAMITDSKKLSPLKRETAFDWIRDNCLWNVANVGPSEISNQGMSRALGFAWNAAFRPLRYKLDMNRVWVVVDGNTHNRFTEWSNVLCLPKADLLIPEVAAASICAKVTRDQLMRDLGALYPEYYQAFFGSKGYGSQSHWDSLAEFGPTMEHRHKFKGVRDSGPVKLKPRGNYYENAPKGNKRVPEVPPSLLKGSSQADDEALVEAAFERTRLAAAV